MNPLLLSLSLQLITEFQVRHHVAKIDSDLDDKYKGRRSTVPHVRLNEYTIETLSEREREGMGEADLAKSKSLSSVKHSDFLQWYAGNTNNNDNDVHCRGKRQASIRGRGRKYSRFCKCECSACVRLRFAICERWNETLFFFFLFFSFFLFFFLQKGNYEFSVKM